MNPSTILGEHVVTQIWGAWRTRGNGGGAIAQPQRARLAEIVAHARARSPCGRDPYRGLPERVEDPSLLPVTDRDVTLQNVCGFIANPEVIGKTFLGSYFAATTSGTPTAPTGLHVRLRAAAGRDSNRSWQTAYEALIRLLAARKLEQVTVNRGREPPERFKGGKIRQVIRLGEGER